MKIISIIPLINNDVEYEKRVSTLTDHYKCDWDDTVHDSFGLYVKRAEEWQCSVRNIRCKAEVLIKEVEELKIDEQIQIAADLCGEADIL